MSTFEKVVKEYGKSTMNLAVEWERKTNSSSIDRNDYYSIGLEVLWKVHKKVGGSISEKHFKNYLYNAFRNRFLALRNRKDVLFTQNHIKNNISDENVNLINEIEDKKVDDNYADVVDTIKLRLSKIERNIFNDIEKTKFNKAHYGNTYSLVELKKKYKLSKTRIMMHIDSIREKVTHMIDKDII